MYHQTPQHTASCGHASQMSGACSSGAANAACTSAGVIAAALARHRELLAAAAILLAAAVTMHVCNVVQLLLHESPTSTLPAAFKLQLRAP